jgi:hypothetical protein
MKGMPDIRAWKRQVLEASLGKLLKDYEAAINQRDMALGAPDRNRLEREAQEIWKQIERQNSELEALELASSQDPTDISKSDAARIQLELHSKLPEIDFEALEKIIRKILRERQDEGCAALLLFQKSRSMGGEWCAERLREMLRRETQNGLFRHIPVKFQPAERVDATGLLRRLGQHLNIESAGQDRQGLSQRVIQKLCGSLQSGSIVLIECQRCDYLSREPGVFHWVLEDFWRQMLNQLAAVAREYYEVKIIVSLFVDGTLPEGCLAVGQCCTPDHFQKDRLLEIALEPWTREDIKEWIARYSGLSLPRIDVDFMANKVYEAACGFPNLIAEQLLNECCPACAG